MEIYRSIENLFEKMSNIAFRMFSNSLVFMAAVGLTVFWFCVHDWQAINMSDAIHDIIVAITFLSFFIIQRTFTHFAQALHLKVNELVTANENARNHVIKAEEKTGEEMMEMAKEHDRIIAEEEVK